MKFTYKAPESKVTIKLQTNERGFVQKFEVTAVQRIASQLPRLVQNQRGIYGNFVSLTSHITDIDWALKQLFGQELVLPRNPIPKGSLPKGSLP